jgi:hypothetical protein
MDSLLSFPVGLFHPYNVPVYPGALRVADDSYRIVEVAAATTPPAAPQVFKTAAAIGARLCCSPREIY